MALQGKILTQPEKAAICLHVFGGVDDWTQLYMIALQTYGQKKEPHKFVDTYVSKWKNSTKVKNYIEQLKIKIVEQTTAARIEGREEGKKTAESERINNAMRGGNSGPVDYYDPKNQRTQINRIIAQAQDDPKTQLDALKAIQQTQREDKQAAKDNKIQRFYTPVPCSSCPLMEKAKKKRRE